MIQVMQTLASGHPADDEEYVDENDHHDDDRRGDGKYGRHGEPGTAEVAAAAAPPPRRAVSAFPRSRSRGRGVLRGGVGVASQTGD